MQLKTLTINDIRSFRPCYDPVTGLDSSGNTIHAGGFLLEDWQGTVIDILKVTACPCEDRLWVVCREELIDSRTLRLFAVWCARQALMLENAPDPRSITACDVAELYANGLATNDELDAARAAARDAAWAATRAAAWAAQIDHLIEMLSA